MNLIDQLGGYEKAKRSLDREIRLTSPNTFYCLKLNDALLEYRRQHNIFEVGDYFCYESKYLSNDPLDGAEYAKLHQLDSLDFECGFVEEVMRCGGIIRHATDEEIKAGRRL